MRFGFDHSQVHAAPAGRLHGPPLVPVAGVPRCGLTLRARRCKVSRPSAGEPCDPPRHARIARGWRASAGPPRPRLFRGGRGRGWRIRAAGGLLTDPDTHGSSSWGPCPALRMRARRRSSQGRRGLDAGDGGVPSWPCARGCGAPRCGRSIRLPWLPPGARGCSALRESCGHSPTRLPWIRLPRLATNAPRRPRDGVWIFHALRGDPLARVEVPAASSGQQRAREEATGLQMRLRGPESRQVRARNAASVPRVTKR